jgi:hypothetical protein
LRDGRVIKVSREKINERLSQGILPYSGNIVARDEKITFDGLVPVDVRTQLFKGFSLIFLDQLDEVWYLVITGHSYGRSNETPTQDWGRPEKNLLYIPLRLKNGKWEKIPILQFPVFFRRANMLILTGMVQESMSLNNKRMSLIEKASWLVTHPPSPDILVFSRPN